MARRMTAPPAPLRLAGGARGAHAARCSGARERDAAARARGVVGTDAHARATTAAMHGRLPLLCRGVTPRRAAGANTYTRVRRAAITCRISRYDIPRRLGRTALSRRFNFKMTAGRPRGRGPPSRARAPAGCCGGEARARAQQPRGVGSKGATATRVVLSSACTASAAGCACAPALRRRVTMADCSAYGASEHVQVRCGGRDRTPSLHVKKAALTAVRRRRNRR